MAADFSLVSVEARGDYNNTFNMHKVKRCHNRILHPLKAQNLSKYFEINETGVIYY